MTLQAWLGRTPARWRLTAARAFNLYPPFVGAGIQITAIAPDLRAFSVELRPLPWNRALDGVHFGGSIYAMCDPFFHVALAAQLGPGYQIWDKGAQIDFRRPGRGTLRAEFQVTPADVRAIRDAIAVAGKCERTFSTDVIGPSGEVVASVRKQLWVRRTPRPTTGVRHEQPTA
jgi:acyl-coenzyme A thioesterase PaaI-like protein